MPDAQAELEVSARWTVVALRGIQCITDESPLDLVTGLWLHPGQQHGHRARHRPQASRHSLRLLPARLLLAARHAPAMQRRLEGATLFLGAVASSVLPHCPTARESSEDAPAGPTLGSWQERAHIPGQEQIRAVDIYEICSCRWQYQAHHGKP